MSSVWRRLNQRSHEAKSIFQENITHWFVVQIFYVFHDRKHGNFKPESEHFNQAQQNYRLLVRKNMIIVGAILTPLILIPIPWTAEIWLFLYCNVVNKLSPYYKALLALEFQKRADMPAEEVVQGIQAHIKTKIEKTKWKIGRIRSLSRKTSALKNQAKEPRKSKKYKKKL